MIEIEHDGDRWRILSIGDRRDGKAFCHLASATRTRQQRNGAMPVQICDWVDEAVIETAPAQYSAGPVSDGGMDPRDRAISDYYTDRNNSGQAALAK